MKKAFLFKACLVFLVIHSADDIDNQLSQLISKASNEKLEVFFMLHKKHFDLTSNNKGIAFLREVVNRGDNRAAQLLLESSMYLFDDTLDQNHYPPLLLRPIAEKNNDIVKLLLTHSFSPDLTWGMFYRPVELAAKVDNVEAMELLFERCADIHCLSKDGRSIVDVAERYGYGSNNCVKWLKAKGVGLTSGSERKTSTFILEAEEQDYSAIVKLLEISMSGESEQEAE